MNDTIAAISTSLGIGSISIIRVSGEDSVKIVNKIFKGKNLEKCESHTINYGYIVDKKEKIDEVLVSIMLAPKSFTKENVVEINCHGGIASTNKILELLITNGCRLAEPGEFSKRAYLNGRIDLVEAEAIMSLIEAETESKRKLAMEQLSGNVSLMIKSLRNKLADIESNIRVNIDYPEYEDIEVMTISMLKTRLSSVKDEITKILNESENGVLIDKGIKTSIIGRPNVGKSSLLNILLNEEKAIVTSIQGTTRDTVEGNIIINGILFKLIDTAGIRKTDDIVENIGVNKSKKLINESNLVILMFDNNTEINEDEKEILKQIKEKNCIIVINKIDLPNKIEINFLKNYCKNIIKLSTYTKEGIDNLKNEMLKIFNLEKIETKNLNYLSSARSISILKECVKIIDDIYSGIENNSPIDMIEIDLNNLYQKLGEITGDTYEDELIDHMFSNFCLGK